MAKLKVTPKKVPTISWTRAAIELWWQKFGVTQTFDDEVWDGKKGDYVTKEVTEVRDFYDVLDDYGFIDCDPDSLQYCCAFAVVGDFNGLPKEWSFAQKCAVASQQILSAVTRGYVLATTIPKQKEAIEILQAIGFEPLKTVINPNTKNRVTLWLGKTK